MCSSDLGRLFVQYFEYEIALLFHTHTLVRSSDVLWEREGEEGEGGRREEREGRREGRGGWLERHGRGVRVRGERSYGDVRRNVRGEVGGMKRNKEEKRRRREYKRKE